jgi:hypothetical protein
MDLVRFVRKAPASHAAHRDYLVTEHCPILNGREQRQGLPIGLYHPAFSRFLASQADNSTESLSEEYDHVVDLIAVSCKYYRSEADRFEALKGPLTKLIHAPLAISVSAGVKADAMVFTSVYDRPNACRAVCKTRNEIGEGASDPSAQAGQAYREYWENVEVSHHQHPCFLSLAKLPYHRSTIFVVHVAARALSLRLLDHGCVFLVVFSSTQSLYNR